MQLRVQFFQQQRAQNVEILCKNVDDGVQGVIASCRHPLSFFRVLLGQFHVVKNSEQHLEEIPPPVRPKSKVMQSL